MTDTRHPHDHAQSLAQTTAGAVALVKELLAAGVLDPATLGLTGPANHGATSVLGPGGPITVKELVAKTERGITTSTRRTYMPYLRILADGWPAASPAEERLYPGIGHKLAHDVLPSDLEEALRWVERRALLRTAQRAERREAVGRQVRDSEAEGARYNAIGAWRRMFGVAVSERHLAPQYNPAADVKKPPRPRGRRRALTSRQLSQVLAVVANTGNDPELDLLLVQTILVSGARREGLTRLTLGGINRDECTIRLAEKFGKVTHQPVPDYLVEDLYQFARSRGATRHGDKVFRTRPTGQRPSKGITSRRFDGLFQRVQSSLAWADRDQVTAHTLRHHAIAVIERSFSKQVATAFARHAPEDTNAHYGVATREEVARAVTEVHGGRHPWAEETHRDAPSLAE